MKAEEKTNRSELYRSLFLLSLVSAITYLLFVHRFGYFNDDWYLMYAAGARGSAVFWDIFSVDRPLRALVMIPAYSLFGANPLYYNLSAYLFRLIGGFSFLWILRMVWRGNNRTTLWMSILFLLYPGFLSQPNAIDYLCHLAGLAAGLLSIGMTLKAVQAHDWKRKSLLYSVSILLGWFYLGQIEWFIGLEFFRFACVFLFAFRLDETMRVRVVRFFQNALPAFLIPIMFLIWRLFFFKSERGATDVNLQLSDVTGEPFAFLFNFLSILFNDFVDVLIQAWWLPLRRLSAGMTIQEWVAGFGIAFLVLFLLWIFSRVSQNSEDAESGSGSVWRREAVLIGIGALVFGLFPVLLVGRSVDFKNFSRYTLVASIGAAIVLPLFLSYISNLKLRNALFAILILSASLTHYFNGFVKAHETEQMNRFWWQVSWRIPQMELGTTLLVNYPQITIEEDYFVWGPANLIYYPDSLHAEYAQPGIYSLVLNKDTIEKILAGERQNFSNRRSIRTYPNYRNILILTQPTETSCVQVISGGQPQYSSFEDERMTQIGSHSEVEHILVQAPFHQPPQIPFGLEPQHDWCFYYEKATLARQLNDWNEVERLGNAALELGLYPQDKIEWMPFLQTYAHLDNTARITEIASSLTSDLLAAQQACLTLTAMPLTPPTLKQADELFCLER